MTPDHEQLLEEMTIFLKSHGCQTVSATYADVCNETERQMLSRIYSVAATYVRTRSDRIAFNTAGVCFEYDAKTNLTANDDIFVEMLPIVSHYSALKWFGLQTVYGFRWTQLDRKDVGFLIDDAFVNLVDAVFIFDRNCQSSINEWTTHMAPHVFANAEVIQCGRGRGSGDPAVKISGHKLNGLHHWKDVLKNNCGI